MVSNDLASLKNEDLTNFIAALDRRIAKLESMFQGQKIPSLKIGDVNADLINTGTLVVKDGTTAAKIVVKDAEDNEIITLTNLGIEVDGGNIVIKNSAGDTVFDALGLVSSTNFMADSLGPTTGIDANANSDFAGTSLNFHLDRAAKVLAFASCECYQGSGAGNGQLGLYIDTTMISDAINIPTLPAATEYTALSNIRTIAAGDHTVKLKNYGTKMMSIQNAIVWYVVLGL